MVNLLELACAFPEGDELTLRQRGEAFEIRFNGWEVMSNRGSLSEKILARLLCEDLGRRPAGPGRALQRLSHVRLGHYETWAQWRRDRTVDPALRAPMGSYEYEDWPRGRIVFDRSRDLFIIYADRKLMALATIARIETQFHLPAERTKVQSDLHYQSTAAPNVLGTRSSALKGG